MVLLEYDLNEDPSFIVYLKRIPEEKFLNEMHIYIEDWKEHHNDSIPK